MEGEEFRAAAKINSKMAQQYGWLKENVFGGREYLTNTNSHIDRGCKEGSDSSFAFNGHPYKNVKAPGYLTCEDEDNVWDGTLKWVQKGLIENVAKDEGKNLVVK